MATWTTYVSASGTPQDMTVNANMKIGLYGDNYGDTITVGEYQSSIHIIDEASADGCDNHPTNKIPSLSHIPDETSLLYHRWTTGSGEINLNTLDLADEGCFKYNFTHGSAVSTSGGIYYGYDGTTQSTAADGLAFWAFEPPDTTWTAASGNGAALDLTDQGSSADHNYYIGISAGPESVGAKTGSKARIEVTYY